jgi:hypothetical protein
MLHVHKRSIRVAHICRAVQQQWFRKSAIPNLLPMRMITLASPEELASFSQPPDSGVQGFWEIGSPIFRSHSVWNVDWSIQNETLAMNIADLFSTFVEEFEHGKMSRLARKMSVPLIGERRRSSHHRDTY